MNQDLLDWQIELIDKRLISIKENPERLLSIEGLLKELDQIENNKPLCDPQ